LSVHVDSLSKPDVSANSMNS